MQCSPTGGDAAEEARARIRRRVAESAANGTKRKLGRRPAPLPLHVPQLPQLDASSLYTGRPGGECAEHAERSGRRGSAGSALQSAGMGLVGSCGQSHVSALVSPPAKRRLGPSLTPLSPLPNPGVAGALPEDWFGAGFLA